MLFFVLLMNTALAQQPVIVRTVSATPVRVSKLKPGDKLRLQVQSSVGPCGESLPKDSAIELTVDRIEKGRGAAWWRHLLGFISVLPAPERAPRKVVARSEKLDVTVAEVYRPKQAVAKGQKARKIAGSVVVLEARGKFASAGVASAGPVTVPAGTQANVVLLERLTASRAVDGQLFQAMVVDPVMVGDKVAIPAGALIDGKVTRSVPPRRLRRAGALSLRFHQLRQGTGIEVAAALSGAEAEGPPVSIDREGRITSKQQIHKMVIDTAIAYVSGKVIDDLIEEGAKGIWGATAAGSAETAARYVGLGVGVGFFLAQRGPDVLVPRYAPMQVAFTRAFVADAGRVCPAN